MVKAVTEPIKNAPEVNGALPEKKGRASDRYKKAFWDNMRTKNYLDIQDALSTSALIQRAGILSLMSTKRNLSTRCRMRCSSELLRVTVINTSSGDRKIPVVTSKGEAQWVDEGGQFKESG